MTSNSPQKLAINPGVQAAIASSAAMVTKGPIPKKLQTTKSGVRLESIPQTAQSTHALVSFPQELSLNEMRQQIPHFIPIGSDTSSSPESDRRGGAGGCGHICNACIQSGGCNGSIYVLYHIT